MKKIFIENKTDFKGSFDSLVETNFHRVVLKTLNNALKYAESNYILFAISHSKQVLIIVVNGDGKGFNTVKLSAEKKDWYGIVFYERKNSS